MKSFSMKEDYIPLSKEDLIALTHVNGREKAFSERSEIAYEIISRKPSFYEKWALMIFFLLLALIVASTWWIKYPEVIYASAVLTGTNAPKEIIPRQSGKLTMLLAQNNQYVKQDEILGWIESTANTSEVIDLSLRLDSVSVLMEMEDAGGITPLFDKKFRNLGELQPSYQTFISAWQEYSDYLLNGFYANKKKMLLNDITALEKMKEKIADQKNLVMQDDELAKKTFEMNERLFEEKVLSPEEYRQAQSTLLNKQKVDPQMEISMISQINQIRDKQKEIDQLSHDILQQQLTFEQALQTLKSNVADWLRKYTIQAPTEGTLVFTLPIQQNQHLAQGKLLGYVNPPDSKFYAEIKLAQNNFGRVDTGQSVQLRFDAYPYHEMGFVKGTINYISDVAIDSGFWGIVRLDKGLTSNQNKQIQYKPGLKAQALVITKDMRLMERLYYSFTKATSTNK